jgi:hypothetical protein
MKRHDYQKGELVWWTLGNDKPIPFNGAGELYLGIITAVAKTADGIEVFWFNNDIFRIMNYESIMRAKASFI